jgi:hypothetical protein
MHPYTGRVCGKLKGLRNQGLVNAGRKQKPGSSRVLFLEETKLGELREE